MPRALVLLMLCLVQVGIPGSELVVLFLHALFPALRTELLAQALRALRELEQLEQKYRHLLKSCPECARDWLLSEVELEIAACRSQIRRVRAELKSTEALDGSELLLQEMLLVDKKALSNFLQQRQELLTFEAENLYQRYKEYLAEQIEHAQRVFSRLARAYRAQSEEEQEVRAEILEEHPLQVCAFCLVPE